MSSQDTTAQSSPSLWNTWFESSQCPVFCGEGRAGLQCCSSEGTSDCKTRTARGCSPSGAGRTSFSVWLPSVKVSRWNSRSFHPTVKGYTLSPTGLKGERSRCSFVGLSIIINSSKWVSPGINTVRSPLSQTWLVSFPAKFGLRYKILWTTCNPFLFMASKWRNAISPQPLRSSPNDAIIVIISDYVTFCSP